MSQRRIVRLHLEISEHAAWLARIEVRGRQVVVGDVVEIALQDGAAAARHIAAARTADSGMSVVCTVRPGAQLLHLASVDEARTCVTADAIRSRLMNGPFSELAEPGITVTSSGEAPFGGSGRGARWLAAGVSGEDVTAMRRLMSQLNVAPESVSPATFALLSAGRKLLKVAGQSGLVAVLDLGSEESSLILLGCDGVDSVQRVPFGWAHFSAEITAETNASEHRAAAALPHDPQSRFSQAAVACAEILREPLAGAFAAAASGKGRKPFAFACVGLPDAQAGFADDVAAALEIEVWRPDVRAWLEKSGVVLGDGLRNRPLPVAWLGLLGGLEHVHPGTASSSVSWFDLAPRREAVSANAGPGRARAGDVRPAPARSELLRSERIRQVPRFPRPLSPNASLIAAATQIAGINPVDTDAAPAHALSDPIPQPGFESAPPESDSRGRSFAGWISLAAAFAVVSGLGYMYFSQVQKQKADAQLEIEMVEQRAASYAAARRIAEQKALQEEQARIEAEALAAQRLADADAAHARAEANALRLLNARGGLRIETEPAGATIAVGNLAPQVSPAVMEDLRLGSYRALISKPGFDPVEVDIEIRENETTDPGRIHLVQQAGGLVIATVPDGVPYEVRPLAAGLFASSSDLLRGKTPATLGELPPGEYVVTLSRERWPRHSQSVEVVNRETVRIEHAYPKASIAFASEPQGASVRIDGVMVGVTPFTLEDFPPGEVTGVFELEGFPTMTISKRLESDATATFEARFDALDRVAKLSEVDVAPKAVHTVHPSLPTAPGRVGRKVAISFEISREGVPLNLVVDEAPDEESGKICLEAVAQWRFTPGLIGGRPVRTRVSLPFMIR